MIKRNQKSIIHTLAIFFLIKNKIKQTISRFLYKFEFKAISVIKKHENTTSLYYINRQFS